MYIRLHIYGQSEICFRLSIRPWQIDFMFLGQILDQDRPGRLAKKKKRMNIITTCTAHYSLRKPHPPARLKGVACKTKYAIVFQKISSRFSLFENSWYNISCWRMRHTTSCFLDPAGLILAFQDIKGCGHNHYLQCTFGFPPPPTFLTFLPPYWGTYTNKQ